MNPTSPQFHAGDRARATMSTALRRLTRTAVSTALRTATEHGVTTSASIVSQRNHNTDATTKKRVADDANSVEIRFIDRDGETHVVRGFVGENLLETAHRNDIELEGACEGSLACSTCHVVFKDEKVFDSLDEACDDENDMLDLAYGLTSTSRLGCQVTCEKGALDGCEVVLPAATRNFAVDGYKPKPH